MLVNTKVIQATPPTNTNKVENLYQSNNLLSKLSYMLPTHQHPKSYYGDPSDGSSSYYGNLTPTD